MQVGLYYFKYICINMCVCVYTYIQAYTDVDTQYTYRVVMDGPLPQMHIIYFDFK